MKMLKIVIHIISLNFQRLIDADKIIFREIDEIGGEYDPYLGCSKSQIDSLPSVEAIPKAEYEARLKADMVAMLEVLQAEIQKYSGSSCMCSDGVVDDIDDLIQEKINKLIGE